MSAYASVATGNWDADSTWANAWVADTVQALNSWRRPTVATGKIYECTARAGDFKTDPSTEPNWALAPNVGDTIVDDQVTWTCRDEYPNDVTAGHSWTVTAGHTVKYNVSETVAMGAGVVNGILRFRTDMSTKMVGGNVTLLSVGAAGEVSGINAADASTTIVTAAYTCEIYNTPTSDGAAYTVTIAAGGKWSLYGDPAYYGSVWKTYLAINADNEDTDTTIVTTDDMSAKWASPQEILIHKKDDYGSYATDCAHYTIASIVGTEITLTGNHAAVDNDHQGIVLLLSRNVKIGKSDGAGGPVACPVGTALTNRPLVVDNNTVVGNADFKNIEFVGIYSLYTIGAGCTLDGCVVRNPNIGIYTIAGGKPSLTGFILTSVTKGFNNTTNFSASNFVIACSNASSGSSAMLGVNLATFSSCEIFATVYGFTGVRNCVFENDCYVYCVNYAIDNAQYSNFTFSGKWGENTFGAACLNDYDFYLNLMLHQIHFKNAHVPSPLTHISRTTNPLTTDYIVTLSHIDGVYGQMGSIQQLGDTVLVLADGADLAGTGLDRPSTDADGVASGSLIQVSNTQSTLTTYCPGVDCGIDQKIWIADETAVTVTFKVQTTYADGIAAGSLKLCVEWISSNTTGETTKTYSSGAVAVRTDNADWTESVSVGPFTTKQAGWIRLSMRLYEYESGNAVWIHPKPYIT